MYLFELWDFRELVDITESNKLEFYLVILCKFCISDTQHFRKIPDHLAADTYNL